MCANKTAAVSPIIGTMRWMSAVHSAGEESRKAAPPPIMGGPHEVCSAIAEL